MWIFSWLSIGVGLGLEHRKVQDFDEPYWWACACVDAAVLPPFICSLLSSLPFKYWAVLETGTLFIIGLSEAVANVATQPVYLKKTKNNRLHCHNILRCCQLDRLFLNICISRKKMEVWGREINSCLYLANLVFSKTKYRHSDKHQNTGLCLGFDSPRQQRFACPMFACRKWIVFFE